MDAMEPQPTLPPPLRPGQLTPGWKVTFVAGWVGVMAAFGAVAQAGRIAGISPWWLGPETDPRFFLIIGLPFVGPVIAILAAIRGLRSTCYIGIAASVGSMAIAWGDREYSKLALVELVIGLAGLLVSVACLGGRASAGMAVTPPVSLEPDPIR